MSTLPAVDLRAVMEGHVLRAAHTTLRATGTQCSILRYSIYGIACTLQKEYQYLAYHEAAIHGPCCMHSQPPKSVPSI